LAKPTGKIDRSPVPRSPVLYIRSVIFNLLFYANVTVQMIAALPTFVLPRRFLHMFVRSYALTSLWLLRVICGTKVEWRGVEKLPKGACILACKHQSAWETFALYAAIDDPTYILKRELMWLPLFGWYMWKEGLIPIDRSAGMAALARMTARARAALAAGRQIVIFPEGTRRLPGAEPAYKPGVLYLYGKAGVPCVPIALNSGLYWPRRSFLRLPGTIVVEILDPIAPGLDREAFARQLEDTIEGTTARLVGEASARGQVSGAKP
jgi:1-acyl-sn-glycerol-3-phosphate acyltransferase